MIPAWHTPDTPMTIHAECQGGPHDGHTQAVTDDTDLLWVGPIKAAWVIESGLTPETVVGQDLHCYRFTGEVKDDGTRIYHWVEPSA